MVDTTNLSPVLQTGEIQEQPRVVLRIKRGRGRPRKYNTPEEKKSNALSQLKVVYSEKRKPYIDLRNMPLTQAVNKLLELKTNKALPEETLSGILIHLGYDPTTV